MFEITLVLTTGTQIFVKVERTVIHANMYEVIGQQASYLFPIRNIMQIIERRTDNDAEN